MNTYAFKNQAIQSRLTASSQKNNVSAPARWIDNRLEAVQIRQLQALANDHVAQHQPPVQRKGDKKELPGGYIGQINGIVFYATGHAKLRSKR